MIRFFGSHSPRQVPAARCASPRKRQAKAVLGIELLEDRRLLSTTALSSLDFQQLLTAVTVYLTGHGFAAPSSAALSTAINAISTPSTSSPPASTPAATPTTPWTQQSSVLTTTTTPTARTTTPTPTVATPTSTVPVSTSTTTVSQPAATAVTVTSNGPTISGFVYNDANNNGIMDPGEVGIPNNTIQLISASGTLVATTTTDANGHYVFSTDATVGTSALTKTVTLNFPDTKTNWTQSQQLAKFDPSLGNLTSVEIVNQGTISSHIRVENLDQSAATVNAQASGTLALSGPGLSFTPLASTQLQPNDTAQSFQAASFDGQVDYTGGSGHDFGAKTASGTQSVTITDPAMLAQYTGTGNLTFTEAAAATSGASGPGNLQSLINSTASAQVTVIYHYKADNSLHPGNFIIRQPSTPPGFIDGQLTAGNVTPLPGSGVRAIPVTLGSTDSTNNNFGEIKGTSLSGFVYADTNNDGVKQPGEAGIPGSKITLSGTDDQGNDLVLTTTSAADGSYQFANLRPGSYTLKQDQPMGFVDGKDTIGSQGGTASSDQLAGITLVSGVNGVNNNFGELPPPAPAVTSLGTPDQPTVQDTGVVTKRDSLMLFWQRRGIQTTVNSL